MVISSVPVVCDIDRGYILCRWIAIRSDTLGGLFTAALGAYLVYGGGHDSSASRTGFSLTMAGQNCARRVRILLKLLQLVSAL